MGLQFHPFLPAAKSRHRARHKIHSPLLELRGRHTTRLCHNRHGLPLQQSQHQRPLRLHRRRHASSTPVHHGIPAVAPSANAPAEPSTMTVESKGALVLRLLQGEELAAVATSSGVPTAQLEQWRVDFMAGAMARLAGG